MKTKKQVIGSEGSDEPVTRRSSRGRKALVTDNSSEEIIPASPNLESSGRKRRRTDASPSPARQTSARKRAREKIDDAASEQSMDDIDDAGTNVNNSIVSPSKTKIPSLAPLHEDMEIAAEASSVETMTAADANASLADTARKNEVTAQEENHAAEGLITPPEPLTTRTQATEASNVDTIKASIAVTPPLIQRATDPSTQGQTPGSTSQASIQSQLNAAIAATPPNNGTSIAPTASSGLSTASTMPPMVNPVTTRPPPPVISIPPPQVRRAVSTSPAATPPLLHIPSSHSSTSLSGDAPLISSIATSMSPSIALLSSTLSSQNDFSYTSIPPSPPLQSPRPVSGVPPPLLPTRSSSESQISLPRYPSAPQNLSGAASARSSGMSSLSASPLLSSSLWPGASTAPDTTYLTNKSVPDRSAFTHVASNASFTAASQGKSATDEVKAESSSKSNKERHITKSLSTSNISSSFHGDVGGQLMLSGLGNVRGQINRAPSISSARSAAQSPVNSTSVPEGKKSTITPVQTTPRQSPSTNKERGEESVPVLHRRREIATTKLLAMERKSLLSKHGAPFVAPRLKSHWDYMMEEMQWMAIDFRQERRWAMSHCKIKAAMCAHYLALKNLNENNGQWNDDMIYPRPSAIVQYDYWKQVMARRSNSETALESRRVSARIAALMNKFWSVETMSGLSLNAASLPMSDLPKPINRTVEEFNKLVTETKQNLATMDKHSAVKCSWHGLSRLTGGEMSALTCASSISLCGYGVALRGESASGKTVIAVALLCLWLAEVTDPILLVTTKSRVHRWKYEFLRTDQTYAIEVFSTGKTIPSSEARVIIMHIEDLSSAEEHKAKQLINSRHWGGVMVDMRTHARHSKIDDNVYATFNAVNAAVAHCSGRRAVIWYKHTITAGLNVELLRYLLPTVFTSVQLVDKWKVWYTREQSGARTADAIIVEDLLANLYVDVGKILIPLVPGTNKESERKPPAHGVCSKRYEVDASKVDLTTDQRRKYGAVVAMCSPWLSGDNVMLFAQSLMLLQRVCFHSDMLYVSYSSDNDNQRGSPANIYSSFNSEAVGTPREFMQLAMDMRTPTAVSPGIVSHRLTAGASIESMSPGHETKSPKLEALVEMIRGMRKSRILVLADTLEQQLLAHQYLSKSSIDHLYGGIDTTLDDSWAYFYGSEEAVMEFNRLAESEEKDDTANQVIVLSEKFYLFQRSASICPINIDLIVVLSQNWCIQPELERFMFDTRNDAQRLTKIVYIVSRNCFEDVLFHAEKSLIKFYNTLCCMDEKNVALSPLAVLQGKALSELQLNIGRTANFQSLFLGNVSPLCPSLCPMLKELFRSNDTYTSNDSSPSDNSLGSNLLLGKGRGKGALTRAPDGSVTVAAATAPPVDKNLQWLQRASAALDLSYYMFSNMLGYALHPDDAPAVISSQDNKNPSTSPPPTLHLGVLYIGPSVALPANDASLEILTEYGKTTLEYRRLLARYTEKHDLSVCDADDLTYDLLWLTRNTLSTSQISNNPRDKFDIGLLGYLTHMLYNAKQKLDDGAVENNISSMPRSVFEDSISVLYSLNAAGLDTPTRHHDIVAQLMRVGEDIDRNLIMNPLSRASGQDVLSMPSWMTKSSSMETVFSIKYNTKNSKSSKKQKQQKSEPKKKSTVVSNELYVTAAHLNSILPNDRFRRSQDAASRAASPTSNPYVTKAYERPRPRGLSAAHIEYSPDVPGLELTRVEQAILRRINAIFPSSNSWFQQEAVNEGNVPLSLSHIRSSQQLRRASITDSIEDSDYSCLMQNMSPAMHSRIAEVLQATDNIRKRRTRGRSIDILGSGDADAPDTHADDLLLQNPNLLAECHASHRSVVQNSFANASLNAVQVFDKLQGKLYPSRTESLNNPPTSSNQLLLQQLTSASSKPVMTDRSFSSPPLLQGQHPIFPPTTMPSLPPASKSADDGSTQGKPAGGASKQQQLLLSHPLLQSPLLGDEYVKKLEHIITTRHVPEFETKLLKTLYSQDSADQQKIVLLKALLSKSV